MVRRVGPASNGVMSSSFLPLESSPPLVSQEAPVRLHYATARSAESAIVAHPVVPEAEEVGGEQGADELQNDAVTVKQVREVTGQLVRDEPSLMSEISRTMLSWERVERLSGPGTVAVHSDVFAEALRRLGLPLYYRGINAPGDTIGLKCLVANSWIAAVSNMLEGYSIIEARKFRKGFEKELAQLKEKVGEHASEEVRENINKLEFWLGEEQSQWNQRTALFGANLTTDSFYLARYTAELAGRAFNTTLKFGIWGVYNVINLPQKVYSVIKAHDAIAKQKEVAAIQWRGAPKTSAEEFYKRERAALDKTIAEIDVEKEVLQLFDDSKLDAFLKQEINVRFPDLQAPEDNRGAAVQLLENADVRTAIAEGIARRRQALGGQARSALRAAVQQRQVLYRDFVRNQRNGAWVNLGLAIAGAVLFCLEVLAVSAGVSALLMFGLSGVGITIFVFGLVYAGWRRPNLTKLYFGKATLAHIRDCSYFYSLKAKRWYIQRKLRKSVKDIEILKSLQLVQKVKTIRVDSLSVPARKQYELALATIKSGKEGTQGAAIQAILTDCEAIASNVLKLEGRFAKYEKKRLEAHWKDFLKDAQAKGIAAVSQKDAPEILAESLANLIARGDVDSETKKILSDQMGIKLTPQGNVRDELVTKIKKFYTMSNEGVAALVRLQLHQEELRTRRAT